MEFKIAVADVGSVSFNINNTSAVTLMFYDTSLSEYCNVSEQSDTQLRVTYFPSGAAAEGDIILQCGYNTTASVAVAKNAITMDFMGGWYEDLSIITIEEPETITITKACMGDANCNGTVNSTDYSLVLSHSMGNATLTPEGLLASDVNFDGLRNSKDTLQIQKYVNGTIFSFWGTNTIVNLPGTAIAGLTAGNLYRLKNQNTGKYLYFNSSGAIPQMVTLESKPTDYGGIFTLNYSNDLCTLKFGNNANLQIDSSNTVNCTGSGNLSFSQYWYLVPKNGGYYMVNYAKKTRMLSASDSSVKYGKDYANNIWVLEPVTVNINYYYDSCYRVRFSNNTTNTVNSIVQYQDEVREIFANVFGIAVTTATPQLMQSYNDMCYSGSITTSNVNNWCPHGGGETTTGENNCLNYDNNTTITPPTSGDIHHNNGRANLYHLRTQKQSSTPIDIQFLMSGHSSCGENIDVENAHKYDNVGGLGNWYYRVAVVFNDAPKTDLSNPAVEDYYGIVAMLHEICHCFGAGYLEDSMADKGTNEGHSNCIMSYENDKTHVYDAWEDGNYNALFCSSCKAEIKAYIMMKY